MHKTPLWRRILRAFSVFGFLRGICTAIGAMFLISMIFSAIITATVHEEKSPLPDQMILTLRMDAGLQEVPSTDGVFGELRGFASKTLSVHDMVRLLDHAAGDPAVKAMVITMEGGDYGIAAVQEMRVAIKRFRASGKPAYVFSSSFAESGVGMGPYYLASAFDEIWLQPMGSVDLPGFNAEMPFGKNALTKLGITPQFYQRKEYKSIMENISRDSMSPENREMTTSLLNDIMDVMVADIASDRQTTKEAVRKSIDQAIFTDKEALAAKLVDHVDFADVLFSGIRKTMTGDAESPDLKLYDMRQYYANALGDVPAKAPMVGFVHAVGDIVKSADNAGMTGGSVIAADRVSAAIIKGMRDDNIKAMVVRIDSPGGSPTASETIRRAIARAIEKGKPVIVSMGAAAGSGGYWIATDATRIFASPATLTGSIGVASGKFIVGDLMGKIGVNWEGIKIGENADINSLVKPFSAGGEERMNVMMDSIYDGFTGRVAAGRKLPPDKVEQIARGRVWTGRQAAANGLVDELGGLDMALDYAAKQVGAADRNGIQLVELPRPRTPFDRIFELLNVEVAMNRIGGVMMDLVDRRVQSLSRTQISVRDPALDLAP